MSNTVDQRTVEMVFDNAQFEKGISETLQSLEALDKSLGAVDSSQFASSVDEMAQSATGLDRVAEQIEGSKSKVASALESFTGLFGGFVFDVSGAIQSAFGIINSAFNFQGGMNRALNIEAAKFQLEGLHVAWSTISDDINYAVMDTAYGLDSAAKAAAQLSASQVAVGDDMKAALRGISGVAAMTNSSYDDIANVFTRVAGQGRVMANDLNSLAARGLNAAATLAEAMDTDEASIRDMVSAGQIGFKEFAYYMDEAFGEQATKANETFTGALSNMNAAWGRFWALFLGGTEKDEEGNISGTGGGILNMMRRVYLSIKQVVSDLGKVFTPIADLLQPVTNAVGDAAENIAKFISGLWIDVNEEFDENGNKKLVRNVARLGNEAFMIFENIGQAITSFVRPIVAFINALLPTFEEFFAWADSIRDVDFTDRLQLTEGAVRMLETAFGALGSLIKNILGPVITGITFVLDRLAVVFIVVKDAVDTFFDALWDVGSTAFEAFSNAIGEIQNPLDSFWKAIDDSKFSETQLGKFLERGGELFQEFWDIIDGAASSSTRMPWDELGAKLSEIASHFFGILDQTGSGDLSKNLKDNYFTPLSNFVNGVKELFSTEGVKLVFGNLGTIVGDIARGFASAAGTLFGAAGEVVGFVLNNLGHAWDILVGIKDGVSSAVGTIAQHLGELGSSAISGLLDVFGIKFAYASDTVQDGSKQMGEAVSGVADEMEKSPIGKLVDGLGGAFGDFGSALKDHSPTLTDWTNLFGGVNTAIGDFIAWLDPIGRMQRAIETIRNAFKDFGTDSFVGWGTKFLDQSNPLVKILDALSNGFSGFWKMIVDNIPTGDKVSEVIGKIADAIAWVIDTASPLFEGIGRIVGTLAGSFIEFLGRVFDGLGNIQGIDLDVVGNSLHNLFEDFNELTKLFANGDFDIFKGLGDALGSLTGLVDPFVKMFLPETAYAAEVASDTIDTISSADISGAAEQVSQGGNFLADAISDIGKKFGFSGIDFKDGGEVVTNAFQWVQDNLALVVGVIAGGAMYFAVMKSLKAFRDVAGSISDVADTTKSLMKGIQEKFGLISKPVSKLEELRELIMSIVKLVAAVAIISLIPPNRIWPAVRVVAVLGGIIVGLIFLMSLINKHMSAGGSINYMGMAAEITAMATAVLIASVSLFLVSMIPQDRVWSAFFILEGMVIGFIGLTAVMSQFDGRHFFASAAALLVMGFALLEFAAVIIVFTFIPWGLLVPGIVAVTVMLAGLITAAKYLYKYAPKLILSAAGLIILAGALYAIVGAIVLLDGIEAEHLAADVAALTVSLAALVAALVVLSKLGGTAPRMMKLAASLVILSSVFAIIAVSISAIALFTQNIDEVIGIAASLGVLFAELALALGILANMTKTEKAAKRMAEVAASLVAVSAAMGIVGASIAMILSIGSTADELMAASIGLTAAFAAMAIALGVLAALMSSGTVNPVALAIAAAGLFAMAAAMYVLASALNKMANVSWDNVLQLVVLMGVFVALGALAGHLVLIAVGIVALGASMLMAGAGVYMFASGIELLATALPQFADAIDQFLEKMITTMQERFPQALDVFIENLQTLAEKAPEIMMAVTEIVVSIITGLCDAIIELVPTIADSLVKMMESAVEWMSANGDRLSDAVTGFAGVLGKMLGTAILAIPQMLGSFIETVVDGIGDMIREHSKDMANDTVDSYVDAYKVAANKMSKSDIVDALKNMDPSKFYSQGSVSWAGGSANWSEATEEAKQYAAILDRIYNDPDLYTYLNATGQIPDGVDAIATAYQDATGAQDHWVETTRDQAEANQELEESVDALVVDYGTFQENLNPIWDMLKDNDLFAQLNLDGTQFADLLSTIGNGDVMSGLLTALGDTTALEEGLTQILGEDQVNALEEQGLSIESIQAALSNATGEAENYGVTLNEKGEEAYYTLQDVHAALADGVDVTAALQSMEELRSSIVDLKGQFDQVNVVATTAFNVMVTQISTQIATANAKIDSLSTHATTAVNGVKSALSNSGVYNSAWWVGKYMVDGFVAGINTYLSNATAAGREIAKRAKDAAKAELGERSPSKVFFEIGKFVVFGFANGIRRHVDIASDVAETMASTTVDTMQSSISEISEMVDMIDWSAQPTIRPVLDTSNVEAGWAYINGLMGGSPMMQAAYAGPRSGRVVNSNSSRVVNVGIDLHYEAGTDATRMVNDIANGLAMKLNLEA